MRERLYNGIVLPEEWPPRTLNPKSREPIDIPYLSSPPEVIPIDVGRQLFVDDFLIDETTLKRNFHLAQKYDKNPILEPQTDLEMNGGYRPVAVPFSDGVFYDSNDGLFKMWYQAGWYDNTALAISKDGIHWERPDLDVVPGTNCVIPPRPDLIRDTVIVWLDYSAEKPSERFKMSFYARTMNETQDIFHSLENIAHDSARSKGYPPGGRVFTSPDGIHWTERAQAGPQGDNTTFFYNPFRKKWIFSIRTHRKGRTRDYWEHSDFLEGCKWKEGEPVFWAGADNLDLPDPKIGHETQLYKINAVAYESIMLGLILIHRGPPNSVCAKGGFPKITELTLGFSRDGFHWHRPERRAFIGATRKKGDWDRAYIHSAGGCCLIVEDKLHFYYGAWSGKSPKLGGDMYAGGSTGVAFLRRDGFASMDAETEGFLTTRKITFNGKYLFVNADVAKGELKAELLNKNGKTIAPFSMENCNPVSEDKTMQMISWKENDNLSSLAGKSVKLKFHVKNGKLYSFWVSDKLSGVSNGYIAAGGPEFSKSTDK